MTEPMLLNDVGPIYGVELLDALPIIGSSMTQALPSRADLQRITKNHQRVAAGYEVLLFHYRHQKEVISKFQLHALEARAALGDRVRNESATEDEKGIYDSLCDLLSRTEESQ